MTLSPTTTTITLNTGASMPMLGLGTWRAGPGEVAAAVRSAIRVGYRHLDCAWMYGNEAEVGAGIREALAAGELRDRSELFVTSKLWPTMVHDPPKALRETLNALGLEYVDLYLMHWPMELNPNGNDRAMPTKPDGTRDVLPTHHTAIWHSMQPLLNQGARAIGVSNYSVPYLRELLAHPNTTVVPAANQVESHPLLPQSDLLSLCRDHNIVLEAYSPLGAGGDGIQALFNLSPVREITERFNREGVSPPVSPANILISWQVARGVVVLPKSSNESRLAGNARLIKLSPADVAALDGVAKTEGTRRFIKPAWPISLGFGDF